jgi:PAS domain S-box-containing protein
LKILIVQDHPTEHSYQAEALLSLEYPDAERVYVSDPLALGETLEREAIDLVVLDAAVSWGGGAEILRTLQDRHPGLPVIWLTPERSATQLKLEQELQHTRLSFDNLLNTPSDLILIIDDQHRVLAANQTFYQLSGKRPEEVIGQATHEYLPPSLAERRDAILHQVFETGEMLRLEDYGVEIWLDITIYPVRDAQGRVRHVVVYAHDITERKRLEDSLRQSQETIDALLNVPTDLIMLLDRQGKFVRVNQTFCQRFKVSQEDAVGKSLIDFLPPALAQERSAMLGQVLESGQAVRFEDQGVTGWYDHSVYPILDDQNQVAYVAVISRDITEHKRMEEILRRDQRTMLAMANTPNDIFVLLDLAGTILQTNEVMAHSLGRSVDELVGLRFWDLLPKPVADFRRAIFDRVVQTGVAERAEDQGRLGIYDSRVTPVTDDQGRVVQVAILARDITERKQIELSLKESEERYRTLVETSPDGIVYFELGDGMESSLQIVNQQFAALFGYTNAEEIVNLKLTESDLVAEHDQTRLKEIVTAGLQNGSVRDASLTARRKDGSTFQLEASGTMVYDSQGKPRGFIAICRDVTERASLQEELVKAHEHLEHRVIERTTELQAANRQMRKEIYLRQQAEEQWRRQALHAGILARVASRANAQLGLKAVLEAICMEIVRTLPYSICCVSLYHEQNDAFYIDAYASQVEIAIDLVPPIPRAMFEEYISRHGSLVIIPDIHSLPSGSNLMTVASEDIHTVISLPLYDDGELIGILSVATLKIIHLPNDDELNLLQAISNQAALSITNTRLFERVSEGQARLKALTERLVEVQEEEIRNVALELHDEIGQMLTSLNLNLEIISRSFEAGETKSSLQRQMDAIRTQVRQLLSQVRDLSLKLLPPMLEDLGLLPALVDHCQRYTAQTGIQVNLAHHGLERRLPAKLETAAYRIIQEALTNAARYAGVNEVEVRLWLTLDELGLQVEDQGIGFDLQQVENGRRSSGISGMRERAANCGGTLEIESSLGQGTCLTAEFPVHLVEKKSRA